MWVLGLLGIFLYPKFTLGIVLLELDYPLLGIIAILASIFSEPSTNKTK